MGKIYCLKYTLNINREMLAMKESIESKIKERSNTIAKDDF
jgi:hypothetical protein